MAGAALLFYGEQMFDKGEYLPGQIIQVDRFAFDFFTVQLVFGRPGAFFHGAGQGGVHISGRIE